MRPRIRLVQLPAHDSRPPHTCLVTGRRDDEVVDFGKDFKGRDPHVYIRKQIVERAAVETLGMRPAVEVAKLREGLEETAADRDRLAEIVAAGEDLSAAEDRLREALGPAPDPEGTQ